MSADDPHRATVTLFKPSGRYYTEEVWRVPTGTIGPHDLERSPDFRRIAGGAVLVDAQEPWGYPHLLPAALGTWAQAQRSAFWEGAVWLINSPFGTSSDKAMREAERRYPS